MTNFEKIKKMNEKELALFLNRVVCREVIITMPCSAKNCEEKYCDKCTEKWLVEEAKD